MQEYASKEALIEEIKRTAAQFYRGIRYRILGWDSDELTGKEVVTPAPGYKWNQMGTIYDIFMPPITRKA